MRRLKWLWIADSGLTRTAIGIIKFGAEALGDRRCEQWLRELRWAVFWHCISELPLTPPPVPPESGILGDHDGNCYRLHGATAPRRCVDRGPVRPREETPR